jgi:hypothetical protein
MAQTQLPGVTGFVVDRISSNDKRAIGKLTDANHLYSIHKAQPQMYDKQIISLYSQTSLYANDFLNLLSGSNPFLLENGSMEWQWDMEIPYQFPQVVEVPTATLDQDKVGIDGKEFDLIIDSNEFKKNDIVIIGSKRFGQRIHAVSDPRPAGARIWVQSFTLVSPIPESDYVNKSFLQSGINLEFSHNNLGEFDQDMAGLPSLGDKMRLMESMGGGVGIEHKITAWADDVRFGSAPRDINGNPLDILVYRQRQRGDKPVSASLVRWEPFIEAEMRKRLLDMKVNKMIWAQPGAVKTGGTRQEVKKESAGAHWRMKNSGNYIGFNRGEFTANMLRTAFGDLFYRRKKMGDRRVKLYANEAGVNIAQQAFKEDALGSGVNFTANVDEVVKGKGGTSYVYGFDFGGMYSRETGLVELAHLQELDLPQNNLEFGQNKMSAPVFMIFDVSSPDGGLSKNIREVRKAGQPNMTWGYVDGRRHHLGAFASQGHSAANKFPGYEVFMEAQYDVFIEDVSRTFLIEELPAY